jgi:hypothetical protein
MEIRLSRHVVCFWLAHLLQLIIYVSDVGTNDVIFLCPYMPSMCGCGLYNNNELAKTWKCLSERKYLRLIVKNIILRSLKISLQLANDHEALRIRFLVMWDSTA